VGLCPDPLTADAIDTLAVESAELQPLADRLDELASAPEAGLRAWTASA